MSAPFIPVADLDEEVFLFHVTRHLMSEYAGQTFRAQFYDHEMGVYTGLVSNPSSRYDDCSAFGPREIYPMENDGVVFEHWLKALRMERHITDPAFLKEGDYIDLWGDGWYFPIDRINAQQVANTGEMAYEITTLDMLRSRWLKASQPVQVLATDQRAIQEWYERWWLHEVVTETGHAEHAYERRLWRWHEGALRDG